MLSADLAIAARHKPLVANWAPEVAAAAAVYAPETGLSEEELGLFVMATIDRETGGKNELGDNGHGHGLMQLDDRFNAAFLATHLNGLDPASNIMEGTRQLAAHIVTMRKAISNVGPVPLDTQLTAASAAYNAGEGREVHLLILTGDISKIDFPTTDHNYGEDVLRRRDEFRAALAASRAAVT